MTDVKRDGDWCTIREAADRMAVSIDDVRLWIDDGSIDVMTIYAPNRTSWTAVFVYNAERLTWRGYD